MRKVLVLLLMVGILIGTVSVVEEISEEGSNEYVEFSGDKVLGDDPGDVVPCGGGEGTGSGGGTPG